MTLWFDVEDLIVFFQHESRPTGIQRLSFEVFREVWKLGGPSGAVRFCRHGVTEAEYIVVEWPVLEAGILAASATAAAAKRDNAALPEPESANPEPAKPVLFGDPGYGRLGLKGRIHHYLFPRITPMVRMPLGVFYRAQKHSLLAVRDLFKATVQAAWPPLRTLRRSQREGVLALRDLIKALTLVAAEPSAPPAKLGELTIRLSSEPAQFAPEDMFISIGASWVLPNAAPGRQVQKHYGLRYAVLIHDLIPELYPEWTSQEGLPLYRAWLQDVVPYADVIFANSRHTAKDLLQRMAEWERPVPMPVVLPVGHYPPPGRHKDSPARHNGNQPSALKNPFGGPFILFVGTIEVRKNHALLFRVWRRLLAELPAAQVPYLVFAGKPAWLTGDLLVQLENAGWLDGHIKLVESPSEIELAALYEACEFTVFPSLYEGWGLPVTESLSFGKTVAASNSSAIPEAGGAFCSYFDPENVSEAYAVIRGLIEHPDRVRALEAKIAEEFRPPGWADTAAALLGHLREAQAASRTAPSPITPSPDTPSPSAPGSAIKAAA